MQGNVWFEPSQLCVNFSLVSVTTAHGWLSWSAVSSVRLIRCEALPMAPTHVQLVVLHHFY